MATSMRRTLEVLVFGSAPLLLLGVFTIAPAHATYAWDFHAFWGAARNVIHGQSPYAPLGVNATGTPYPAYLYPPLLAELIAPLGALPFMAAALAFVAGSIAALVGALLLLGVRDWRCYGAAFLWAPTLHGIRLGAITPFLVLAIAGAWRLRDRKPGRMLLPLAATLKLFLWPLLTVRTLGIALLLTVGSWSLVGFAGFTAYPSLLRSSQGVWEADGYGVGALIVRLGASHDVTNTLLFLGGLSAVAVAARLRLDPRAQLSLAIVVALLVSPAVWLHYATLLIVPVALFRPRLHAAWLAPLALWLTPVEQADGAIWRIALFLAVVIGTPLLARRTGAPVRVSRRVVPG
jgi:hypothetical protein